MTEECSHCERETDAIQDGYCLVCRDAADEGRLELDGYGGDAGDE